MTIKIRKSVFETNSSSTHSICIAKEGSFDVPSEIHFEFGEFGWEYDRFDSTWEKASYLYTGLFANERHEDIERIGDMLREAGVAVTFQDPGKPTVSGDWRYYPDSGYVDHSDELKEFLDAVVSDSGSLMRFLFSGLSFIITGNDNSEHDVSVNVSYPHDKFYKGN